MNAEGIPPSLYTSIGDPMAPGRAQLTLNAERPGSLACALGPYRNPADGLRVE